MFAPSVGLKLCLHLWRFWARRALSGLGGWRGAGSVDLYWSHWARTGLGFEDFILGHLSEGIQLDEPLGFLVNALPEAGPGILQGDLLEIVGDILLCERYPRPLCIGAEPAPSEAK